MGYIGNLFKIFKGTTADDGTGTPARDAATGLNSNMDAIDNALQTIDNAAEKKANKAVNLDAPNDTNYPSTKAVSDAIGGIEANANTYTDTQLNSYQATSEKGQASGYAPLDNNKKVPIANTYAAVDEIVEGEYINATTFNDTTGTAVTPGTAKIYQDITTGNPTSGKQYRWGGSQFVEIIASPGTTDEVVEGTTNLYFTAARVRATLLDGIDTVVGGVIAAGDSVLSALGKLQAQVTSNKNTLGTKLDKGTYTGTASDLETLAASGISQTEAQAIADAKVEDQIVDGVVDKAPSQNVVFDEFGKVVYGIRKSDGTLIPKDANNEVALPAEKYPFTDEFVFTTGDPQVKTLTYTPLSGLVQVYVQGIRLFSTQYNLLNEKQVEILDTLTDGDTIAVDYTRLTDELITLLLLTPHGGIEEWTTDRNSTATYVDSNGVIQTAAVNEPRIDYRTGSARILVEGQSTNLFPSSNQYPYTNRANLATGISDPANGTNAVLVDTTQDGAGTLFGENSFSLTAGKTYKLSYFVKKNNQDWLAFNIGAGSNFQRQWFNISSGVLGDSNSTGSGLNFSNVQITHINNGWYRCSVSFTPVDSAGHYVLGVLTDVDGVLNSSVGDKIYSFGRQIEEGVLTSYIPTNGSTVTRLADVITKNPPSGTTKIIETVDGVTNEITTIPATYQLPVGNVEKIEMV